MIFIIFCKNAKEEGKQYTKRILPPFVIPECNISLENDFIMLNEMGESNLDIDKAGNILGTYCEKTIRYHYKLIQSYVQTSTSQLYIWLSEHIIISSLPPYNHNISIIKLYNITYLEILKAEEKKIGCILSIPKKIAFIFPIVFFEKSRKKCHFPLNLSFVLSWYFDTS